jgi:hypothetical protein
MGHTTSCSGRRGRPSSLNYRWDLWGSGNSPGTMCLFLKVAARRSQAQGSAWSSVDGEISSILTISFRMNVFSDRTMLTWFAGHYL